MPDWVLPARQVADVTLTRPRVVSTAEPTGIVVRPLRRWVRRPRRLTNTVPASRRTTTVRPTRGVPRLAPHTSGRGSGPGLTLRIREFSVSAIRNPPSGVDATHRGPNSEARVGGPPSPKDPTTPLPATVLIVPLAETLRMRWLRRSAMRKPPSAVTETLSAS